MSDPAWRDLERLVAWIEQTVSIGAVVEHDVRLPDRDTGQPRQIDVLVKLQAGRHTCVVIGEVRDRGAASDVQWVEQVEQKRLSVGAQSAFLVSRSGFSAPAVAKSRRLGIRALTFEEATSTRWDEQLRLHVITFTGVNLALDSAVVDFRPISRRTGRIFDPTPSTFSRWVGHYDPNVGLTIAEAKATGTLAGRLHARIVEAAFRQRDSGADDPRMGRYVVAVRQRLDSPIRARERGSRCTHVVDEVEGRVAFIRGAKEFPLALMRYREVDGDTHAVVLRGRLCVMGMELLAQVVMPDESGIVSDLRNISASLLPLNERAQRLCAELRLGAHIVDERIDESGRRRASVVLSLGIGVGARDATPSP